MSAQLVSRAPPHYYLAGEPSKFSILVRGTSVTIVPRPKAACCGALGCPASDGLVFVDVDGGKNGVFCPGHVSGWVRREAER